MKKNKLLITFLSILLITFLVGLWGYNKYFKPDQEIQQQLNDQFGSDFFNSFDKELVIGSEPVKNESNSGLKLNVDEVKSGEGSTEAINSPPPPHVNEPTSSNVITQDDISKKYTSQFNYLQGVALSRLDTLYSAAMQEYVQNSKAGTLKRSELAQKYIQAGTMLESKVDSQFYSALDAMTAELIANNLPTDITGVIKLEYEKAKSAKRSQLLAKMRN